MQIKTCRRGEARSTAGFGMAGRIRRAQAYCRRPCTVLGMFGPDTFRESGVRRARLLTKHQQDGSRRTTLEAKKASSGRRTWSLSHCCFSAASTKSAPATYTGPSLASSPSSPSSPSPPSLLGCSLGVTTLSLAVSISSVSIANQVRTSTCRSVPRSDTHTCKNNTQT